MAAPRKREAAAPFKGSGCSEQPVGKRMRLTTGPNDAEVHSFCAEAGGQDKTQPFLVQ